MKADDLFDCTRCGDCCKGYGGTYVDETDMAAIARYVGLTAEEVRKRYCLKSGSRYLLTQADDGYCVFWDGLCRIHPVKPRMCRAWPFIESVLADVGNWHFMATMCPGMRTDVSDRKIIACVARQVAKRKTPLEVGSSPHGSRHRRASLSR
jgi:Fe-S-cluster containining protein